MARIIMVLAVAVLGIVVIVGSGGSDDPFDDGVRKIEYRAFGSAKKVTIIYATNNAVETIETKLPWGVIFDGDVPFDAVLSAVNSELINGGNINLQLFVDDTLYKQSLATGPNTFYIELSADVE